MIREFYPHNRVQTEQRARRRERAVRLLILLVCVCAAMIGTKPAFAATLDMTGSGGTDSNTVSIAGSHNPVQLHSDSITINAFKYSYATGTGIAVTDVKVLTNSNCSPSCGAGYSIVTLWKGSTLTGATLLGTSSEVTNATHSATYQQFNFGGGITLYPNQQYYISLTQVNGTADNYWNASNFNVQPNTQHCESNPSGDPYCYPSTTSGRRFQYYIDGSTSSPYESASLTPASGPYLVNKNINFVATWSGATFDPFYLYFYQDIESTAPTQVVYDYPMGTTGTWAFSEPYQYAGTYHPMVALANSSCTTVDASGAPSGTGCIYFFLQSPSTITVYDSTTYANNLDVTYPSTFTATPNQDIKVGQTNVSFKYNLASNFCGTLSGARFFKGYAPQLQYLDSGAILPTSYSGSYVMQFNRTDQPYSDFFYPYIHLYCNDGSYWNVYLGGSTVLNNAQGVSVYEPNDVRFAMPYSWLNGGGNANFETGSGYSFWSDKNVYNVGEPVKLQYDINPTFTASGVDLYDNVNGTKLFSFSGSDITSNSYHYATITYANAGTYQPYLLIRATNYNSSDPSTYKIVYIGGASTPNPANQIYVTKQGAGIWVNTGAFLGQFAGTGGTVNYAGIFGLPNGTFSGFGSTGNAFLDGVLNIFIMPVINGALWVMTKLYTILAATPFFNFLITLMAPSPGTSYVVPTYVIGTYWQLPPSIAGQSFTIAYGSAATWGFTYPFILAIFFAGLLRWLLKAFL